MQCGRGSISASQRARQGGRIPGRRIWSRFALLAVAIGAFTLLNRNRQAVPVGVDPAAEARESSGNRHFPSPEPGFPAAQRGPIPDGSAGGWLASPAFEAPSRFPYLFSFEGNRAFSDADLFALVSQDMPENSPDSSIEGTIQARLTEFYRSRGFLDFRLDELSVLHEARPRVLVRLREGERYRFGDIQYRDGFPELQRFLQSRVRAGDPADLAALIEAKDELKDRFRNRGYLDFRYEAMYHTDREAHRVDVFIHLEKGAKYRIGNVTFPNFPPELRALLALEGREYRREMVDPYVRAAGLTWTDLEWIKHADESRVDLVAGPEDFRISHHPARAGSDNATLRSLQSALGSYGLPNADSKYPNHP